jgi:hypothetical protein
VQAFRTVTRRSFLARVAGGGLVAGAGLSFGAAGGAAQPKGQPETRRMVVDADPRDPARPPRTHASMAPPSRPTDQDSGPRSDAAGTGGHARRSNAAAPRERFVVCPGNPRCPA